LFRGYPRLDCAQFHAGVSDGYLYAVVAHGGPAVGRDKAMKPFEAQLGTDAVVDLVLYLRSIGH
jgi:hypothetical protein